MTARPAVVDHGQLAGLADDDHSQYPLQTGAETISGDWEFSTSVDFTSGAPQITISSTVPRFEFRDTTPTNGDTWFFQGANANFRIRNSSNSDGELRIEERLDLNRFYDPLFGGSAFGIITFDPTYDVNPSVSYTDNLISISPNVGDMNNENLVVLLGGGSYTYTGNGGLHVWSMFRAAPSISTVTTGARMTSPIFFDVRASFRTDANIVPAATQFYKCFVDRSSIEVDDGASAVTEIANYIAFSSEMLTVNDDQGTIQIDDKRHFSVTNASHPGEIDDQYGLYITSMRSDNLSHSIHVEAPAAGSEQKREIMLMGSGGIHFREDVSGTTRVYSPTTDDLTIESAADVLIDSVNLGFYGVTPVAQSAAYTLNATVVEDRTLLASASATTINNNNVLAALIADLQAVGVLG